MFYIYGRRRDNLAKSYWNRRKNIWQDSLSDSCLYPTRIGVNRIYEGMVKSNLVLGRMYDELGFNKESAQ